MKTQAAFQASHPFTVPLTEAQGRPGTFQYERPTAAPASANPWAVNPNSVDGGGRGVLPGSDAIRGPALDAQGAALGVDRGRNVLNGQDLGPRNDAEYAGMIRDKLQSQYAVAHSPFHNTDDPQLQALQVRVQDGRGAMRSMTPFATYEQQQQDGRQAGQDAQNRQRVLDDQHGFEQGRIDNLGAQTALTAEQAGRIARSTPTEVDDMVARGLLSRAQADAAEAGAAKTRNEAGGMVSSVEHQRVVDENNLLKAKLSMPRGTPLGMARAVKTQNLDPAIAKRYALIAKGLPKSNDAGKLMTPDVEDQYLNAYRGDPSAARDFAGANGWKTSPTFGIPQQPSFDANHPATWAGSRVDDDGLIHAADGRIFRPKANNP